MHMFLAYYKESCNHQCKFLYATHCKVEIGISKHP